MIRTHWWSSLRPQNDKLHRRCRYFRKTGIKKKGRLIKRVPVIRSGLVAMASVTTDNVTNSPSNGSLVGPATPVDNSLWGQIEQFYSDKNNMAMYLVLPLIVLVYGGCSLIFCIYKCMGYCKKSKRRKDRQLLIKENRRRSIVTQRQVDNRPRSTASIHPEITQTTEQKTRTTPLPWEVPDNSETKVKQMDARSKHGNTMPQKGPKTHTGKTPPPPYQEVEDVIYLSGPKQPGYPTSGYQPKKQEYSPLELTKQLLRIGDEEKNLMRGRKKRLVFTTD